MKKAPYKIVSGGSKGERAIDELIDVMGRATIKAVLQMSAEAVAGPKEQGRRDADRELYWHGVQAGHVALKEQQSRVDKPRLRKKRPRADESGEVEVPAYKGLAAVGVDADGRKHVLGLCGGASENAEAAVGLLEDLVARGLRAGRRRLFVIDGAKALCNAIGRVFGSSNLVQRCRNHKLRNLLGHLPKEQHEQARATLRAAWKLDADEGIRKLEQYASWLEREWPSAAASLREGLSEMFTVNRLGLPKALRRCLTTNIIDSSHAGVRQHTNRVSRWRNEAMTVRWAAVTFRETE